MVIPEPTTTQGSFLSQKGDRHLWTEAPIRPPARGVQMSPQPVPLQPQPVVARDLLDLPLTGQDHSETDFIPENLYQSFI